MVTLTLRAGISSNLGTVETSTNNLFAYLIRVYGVAVLLALPLVADLLTLLLRGYLCGEIVG